MAALLAEDMTELSCVLIPVGITHLLLPNVTVAEIVPWRRVKGWEGAPDWCLGLLGWRGETLPVVQFEALNGESSDPGAGRCLLVMNRARARQGRPFYGLVAEGLPRLVRLTGEDLVNQNVKLGPAEIASVRVGAEMATIPNLSFIEEQLGSLTVPTANPKST
jgi:chemosensory pili system protein ChpC